MGYMGLNHWGESDNSSGFLFEIQEKLGKSLNALIFQELKNRANNYNTPGEVNVSLLIEDGAIPVHLINNRNRDEIMLKLKDLIQLNKQVKPRDKNTLMHLKAYKRLLKNVKKEFKSKSNYED